MPSKTVITLILLLQACAFYEAAKHEYYLHSPWPYVEQLFILRNAKILEASLCVNTTQLNLTNCSLPGVQLFFVELLPDNWTHDTLLRHWKYDQKLIYVETNVSIYGWTNATMSRNQTHVCVNLHDLSLKSHGKEFKMGLLCHPSRYEDERYYGWIFMKVACNGRTVDEKIIEVQHSPASFSEGADIMINWTYCKANVSSINGFIVYRDLYPRKHVHLLSMDLNGKVLYTRNKENILLNRIDLKGNVHLITFTIKNVSENDSGYYRLEIRRHGNGDLYSRVKIIVEPSEKTTNFSTTDRPTSPNEVKREDDDNLSKGAIAGIVIAVLLVIVIIVIAFRLKRRPRMGPSNINPGSCNNNSNK